MSSLSDIFGELQEQPSESPSAVLTTPSENKSTLEAPLHDVQSVETESVSQEFNTRFTPLSKTSLAEISIPQPALESLVLKFLLVRGAIFGQEVCSQIKLSYSAMTELLRAMKADQLIAYKSSTGLSDFQYVLTPEGAERAQRDYALCTYFGSVPIGYQEYLESVAEQSLDHQTPTVEKLKDALQDLSLTNDIFNQVGQAINSARALFLYGSPGNGKTSIAQRLCTAFGNAIWIPRSIIIEDQIVRLFDPAVHKEIIVEDHTKIDPRWALIERPTIVAGGELKLEHLEMSVVENTGIVEAPLQLKSNCGLLLIDDFGRQQMTTTELLNRWILPLETRCDFLSMPSGKKIRVPFEQMIVFSTNLEPRELVDEAFLRRIPYKIHAPDPTVEQFHQLFQSTASQLGIEYREEVFVYLMVNQYEKKNRPMRFCHPRDLLSQVKSYCNFTKVPAVMSEETINAAASNYFVD